MIQGLFIILAFSMAVASSVLSLMCHVEEKKVDKLRENLMTAIRQTLEVREDLNKALVILDKYQKSNKEFTNGLIVTIMDIDKRVSILENAPRFEVLKKEEEDG